MEAILETWTANRNYFSVLGGSIAHLVLGTIYTTGNLTIYMASYLQHNNKNVNPQDLSILLPLQICGITLTMILGSSLLARQSSKVYDLFSILLFGNMTMIISAFLASFCTSYMLICLFYGILQGMGAGISYTVPLIVGWSQYPSHKGRISGLTLAGFGMGSSIFNLVSTHMINPENHSANERINGELYFDSEIAGRFPSVLRQLCLIYLFLSIIAVGLLTKVESSSSDELKESSQQVMTNDECPSIKEGLKSKVFWFLLLMSFFSIMPGYFVANCFKVFGRLNIEDDQFLAIVGSVSSFFNGSIRVVWGWMMDQLGFKKSYAILLMVQTVLMFLFYHISAQKYLYLVWVSIILVCEGGHFVLFSAVSSKVFGKENGGRIYSFLTYGFAAGALISFIFQSVLTSILGYQGLINTLSVLSLVSPCILLAFQESQSWSFKLSNIELS